MKIPSLGASKSLLRVIERCSSYLLWICRSIRLPLLAVCAPAAFHPLVEEAPQVFGTTGVPELSERLGFDLADAFACHVELLADLLERVVGIHVDTETHTQHLGFASG